MNVMKNGNMITGVSPTMKNKSSGINIILTRVILIVFFIGHVYGWYLYFTGFDPNILHNSFFDVVKCMCAVVAPTATIMTIVLSILYPIITYAFEKIGEE